MNKELELWLNEWNFQLQNGIEDISFEEQLIEKIIFSAKAGTFLEK